MGENECIPPYFSKFVDSRNRTFKTEEEDKYEYRKSEYTGTEQQWLWRRQYPGIGRIRSR